VLPTSQEFSKVLKEFKFFVNKLRGWCSHHHPSGILAIIQAVVTQAVLAIIQKVFTTNRTVLAIIQAVLDTRSKPTNANTSCAV
jgi:orotate phosphoribosyltransferase-like protein